ncbi:MAG: ribosome-binding factor A [Bacteroides sp.]|nr:MAG: ribosome-binding factor A [Bacteroides sp.]
MKFNNKKIINLEKIIQYELMKIFSNYQFYKTRNGIITITDVIVTKGLEYAKVYISFYGTYDINLIMNNINKCKKNIRFILAKRIKNKVRIIPDIMFLQKKENQII